MKHKVLSGFLRDETGAVLIYTTVIITLLFGVAALAIDASRLSTVHTGLQNAADAAALAGARELRRTAGSIERAKAAAVQALENYVDFAAGGTGVAFSSQPCGTDAAAAGGCIRFLKGLPASDDDPVTAAYETTLDEEARFIEVRTAPATNTGLFVPVLGQAADSVVSARAIAGNDSLMCSVPPLFMCNPVEGIGGTSIDDLAGQQYKAYLKSGGGSQFFPGNFGLLCPAGAEDSASQCGANVIQKLLASQAGTCVKADNLTTKPGASTGKVISGVNVRFDLWDNNTKNWKGDDADGDGSADIVPAANVTKGMKANGNSCTPSNSPNANEELAALPRDQTWHTKPTGGAPCDPADDSCRFGQGDADYDGYFRINHQVTAADNYKPADWPVGMPRTRYNIYRYEIERNQTVSPNVNIPEPGTTKTAEEGTPQCFSGSVPSDGIDWLNDQTKDLRLLRDPRVMPIAIVDCNSLGNDLQGKSSFPADTFAFVFITEPMDDPSGDPVIYTEVLGELDDGAKDDLMRDVVQIYRR